MHPAILIYAVVLLLCWLSPGETADCSMTRDRLFHHAEIGSIQVVRDTTSNAVGFVSQMQVNTDGAPDSYHPNDIGITHICNGISIGSTCKWKANCLTDFRRAKGENFRGPTKICFFAMVTNTQGLPLIQGETDPNPGYFISTTALHQPGQDVRTPAGQLDSNTIPFAVIPSTWQSTRTPGPRLGDFGVAYRRSTNQMAFFVIGDIGPRNKLGEGSIALHRALGNDPFMMRFGVRRARRGIAGKDVLYIIFSNTAQPNQRLDLSSIKELASPQLERFGGIDRLTACAELLTN